MSPHADAAASESAHDGSRSSHTSPPQAPGRRRRRDGGADRHRNDQLRSRHPGLHPASSRAGDGVAAAVLRPCLPAVGRRARPRRQMGVLRYWWVAAKLAISLVLLTLVAVSLRFEVADQAARAKRLAAGEPVTFDLTTLVYPPTVSPALLLVALTLSARETLGTDPESRIRIGADVPVGSARVGSHGAEILVRSPSVACCPRDRAVRLRRRSGALPIGDADRGRSRRGEPVRLGGANAAGPRCPQRAGRGLRRRSTTRRAALPPRGPRLHRPGPLRSAVARSSTACGAGGRGPASVRGQRLRWRHHAQRALPLARPIGSAARSMPRAVLRRARADVDDLT